MCSHSSVISTYGLSHPFTNASIQDVPNCAASYFACYFASLPTASHDSIKRRLVFVSWRYGPHPSLPLLTPPVHDRIVYLAVTLSWYASRRRRFFEHPYHLPGILALKAVFVTLSTRSPQYSLYCHMGNFPGKTGRPKLGFLH